MKSGALSDWRGAVAVSVHLPWMVARNCSSCLIERNEQTDSTDSNKLKTRNAVRDYGLIRRQTAGVGPVARGEGAVVIQKRSLRSQKPVTGKKKRPCHQEELLNPPPHPRGNKGVS
ncbi:60S ribosomal protein L28-like [Pteropus medius]|uniref:60S ribosomal protein L28-like n=1 Tax=Pteropus vampyrus TaxID=132908 RepID=UPI00196A1FDD|nr:60S ribosomal protein L28-like [Pteropus giganteus]